MLGADQDIWQTKLAAERTDQQGLPTHVQVQACLHISNLVRLLISIIVCLKHGKIRPQNQESMNQETSGIYIASGKVGP